VLADGFPGSSSVHLPGLIGHSESSLHCMVSSSRQYPGGTSGLLSMHSFNVRQGAKTRDKWIDYSELSCSLFEVGGQFVTHLESNFRQHSHRLQD